VDFPAVRQILLDAGFEGWCTVEQDCDPTLDVACRRCAGEPGLSGIHRLQRDNSMAKLNWGMIGGGEGSQIGPAHRSGGAGWTGISTLSPVRWTTGPTRGRAYAQRLGVAADRAYGDWREMLEGERNRPTGWIW
jgi:hypothetical protein